MRQSVYETISLPRGIVYYSGPDRKAALREADRKGVKVAVRVERDGIKIYERFPMLKGQGMLMI